MRSKKKIIYAWANDFTNSRGEGILARQFIKDITKFTKDEIYINGQRYSKIKKEKLYLNTNFISNYVKPFIGILNIWSNHFKSRKTIYLNYLPLWNVLIFIFLPSRTILGPITGGAKFDKDYSFNYFIRKYIFPLFYFISIKVINYKFKKVLFSTDLLKIFIKEKKKFIFNYCLSLYKKKNYKIKKKYDLIFYYRKHKNKNNLKQKLLIKKLISFNYKVLIIGDDPKIIKSKYLGNLDRQKTYKYISKSRYAVNNSENILSIFSLDCLSCGTKVINFGNYKSDEKFFDNSDLININVLNINQRSLKIVKLLKKKKLNKPKSFFKKINIKKKEINYYFSSLGL